MGEIPVTFKRVTAVFDSEAVRTRLTEGSGNKHSAESLTDLFDVANSFLEMECKESKREGEEVDLEIHGEKLESVKECADYEAKDVLKGLFVCQADGAKRSIHGAVEKALLEVGNYWTPDFKQSLMA